MCVRRLAGQLLRQNEDISRVFQTFSSSPLRFLPRLSLGQRHFYFDTRGLAAHDIGVWVFSRALKLSQVGNACVQNTAAHC